MSLSEKGSLVLVLEPMLLLLSMVKRPLAGNQNLCQVAYTDSYLDRRLTHVMYQNRKRKILTTRSAHSTKDNLIDDQWRISTYNCAHLGVENWVHSLLKKN